MVAQLTRREAVKLLERTHGHIVIAVVAVIGDTTYDMAVLYGPKKEAQEEAICEQRLVMGLADSTYTGPPLRNVFVEPLPLINKMKGGVPIVGAT